MKDFEEIPVRTRMNNYFGKRTIVFGDLDLLEKMVRQSEMQSTIELTKNHIKELKEKTPQEAGLIKYNEMTVEWLENHFKWSEEMWNQGAFALQYNHHMVIENIKLKHENAELKKEIETLKKQIEF